MGKSSVFNRNAIFVQNDGSKLNDFVFLPVATGGLKIKNDIDNLFPVNCGRVIEHCKRQRRAGRTSRNWVLAIGGGAGNCNHCCARDDRAGTFVVAKGPTTAALASLCRRTIDWRRWWIRRGHVGGDNGNGSLSDLIMKGREMRLSPNGNLVTTDAIFEGTIASFSSKF